VKEAEREEAKRVGAFMKVITPTSANVVSIRYKDVYVQVYQKVDEKMHTKFIILI
jgi:hypothetical protein